MKHKLLQTWARKSAKLLAAVALLATTAFGATAETSYIIQFSTGTNANGTDLSNKNVQDFVVETSKEFVSGTFFNVYKAYGNTPKGVKLGSSGNAGIFGFNLESTKCTAAVKSITINGAYFNNTKDANMGIKIYLNGSTSEAGSLTGFKKDELSAKTLTLADPIVISSIKLETYNTENATVTSTYQARGYVECITLAYDNTPVDPNKIAAPTFTPDGGEVDINSTVTITGDDKALSLKYWFGDDETAATTVTGASATVTITEACTLNAIAIGEGDAVSATKTASFTINPASYPNTIYYSHCTSDDSGFEAWGVAGVTNPWTIDATYGLKATGYKSGANTETEGVMSSPVLDLTNRANITLDFDQAINMFKNGKTVLSGEDMAQINNYISVVIAEVEDETIPTDWTKLADATLPESQSWDFYAQNPAINLDAYKGKKVRIGFKYTSTTEMAGTWEIKNVLVRGDIAPEIPAPTAAENVTITEGEGSWTIRPESYPVVLTFAVEDGVQMYAKSISDTQAQAAAEGDNDGYTVLEGNTLTLTAQGDNYSVYAMKDGVKSVAKSIVADAATGIAGIEAEDGEAVYFNLQGVRVQNPENGVFIRVQNGKAVKIVK